MDTQDAIDYTTAPAAVVDARAAELFGRLAALERDEKRRGEALALQRLFGARAASARPAIKARPCVTVDVRRPGELTTTDAKGARTSASPDILGWRYALAILKALAEAGPHARCLALRATDLGIRPDNPGTALRNHLARAAEYLEADGHASLASLLLSLVVSRDGRVSVDRRSALLTLLC